MPNTTRGYPYPADTDPADVPADMQAALEAVDADVTGVEATADGAVAGLASTDATVSTIQTNVNGLLAQNLNARLLELEGVLIQRGSTDVPINNASWTSITQTFPVAFSATPTVVASARATAGVIWIATAYNPSTTGFSCGAGNREAVLVTQTITVDWIAIGPS